MPLQECHVISRTEDTCFMDQKKDVLDPLSIEDESSILLLSKIMIVQQELYQDA